MFFFYFCAWRPKIMCCVSACPLEDDCGRSLLRSASTGRVTVKLPAVQTSIGQRSLAFHGPTVRNSFALYRPWTWLVWTLFGDNTKTAFAVVRRRHISLRAFVGQPMWKVVATSALLPPWSLLSRPSVQPSTLGDRAFPVAASRASNSLPPATRTVSSFTSFRQQLKTHLFRLSFWLTFHYLPHCYYDSVKCPCIVIIYWPLRHGVHGTIRRWNWYRRLEDGRPTLQAMSGSPTSCSSSCPWHWRGGMRSHFKTRSPPASSLQSVVSIKKNNNNNKAFIRRTMSASELTLRRLRTSR